MRIPTTLPEIGVAIREILSDRAVMARAELLADLQRRGLGLGIDPADTLDELLESDDVGVVLPLADERVTYLPALLDGRTFTHRLTDAEVAHGFIETGADLHPLALLTDEPRYQRLCDGSPVTEILAGIDDDLLRERGLPADGLVEAAWLLAPGALAGVAGGELVGIAVRPDGLELGPVTSTQSPADLAERLIAAITREGRGGPAPLDSVFWALCADDPTLFTTPFPPLDELLDEHGFVHDADQLAPPGFDLPGWRAERRREHIQHIYDIDGDAALAVLVLKRLHDNADELLRLASDLPALSEPAEQEQYGSGRGAPEEEDAGEVVHAALELLADPDVAEPVAAETMGTGGRSSASAGWSPSSCTSARRCWNCSTVSRGRRSSSRRCRRASPRPSFATPRATRWCSARRHCAAPNPTSSSRRSTRPTNGTATSRAGTSTSRRTACAGSGRSSRWTARR